MEPAIVKRWLLLLFVVGLIARAGAVLLSKGIIHPDEHQQYIEQSFRAVHGFGATFWEQDHGMRHPFMRLLLGGFLWVSEAFGVRDPHALAALQRLAVCGLSYAAMWSLIWSRFAQARSVEALALGVMVVGGVDLTFIEVRVMSENVAIAFLAFALAVLPRAPSASGLFLAMMVMARLQTAPLAAGIWAVAVWRTFRGEVEARVRLLWMSAGLGIGVFLMGLTDLLVYGRWFHSSLASFQKQVVEDGASAFSISPWYALILAGSAMLLRWSIFAFPLLAWGSRLKPAESLICIAFVVAHSLIPHKEARFLWPVIPLLLLIAAAALNDLAGRGILRRRSMVAALILSVVAPSVLRSWNMQWNAPLYNASCEALARSGRRGDLHGVVLCGVPRWAAGNYFFLRRDVPIHYLTDPAVLDANDDWQAGRLNYLAAPAAALPEGLTNSLEVIDQWDDWTLYRRRPSLAAHLKPASQR